MSKVNAWLEEQNKHIRAAIITSIIVASIAFFLGCVHIIFISPPIVGLIFVLIFLIITIYCVVLES